MTSRFLRSLLVLGLGLGCAAPALAQSPVSTCSNDAGLCAEGVRTPLGLPLAVVGQALDSGRETLDPDLVEAARKGLLANPGDDMARLTLIAAREDGRDAKEIRASLDAIIARADAAHDRAVAALARLLSIRAVDDDDEAGAAKVDALATAALGQARAIRSAAAKAPTQQADMADQLAGLIADGTVDALVRDDDVRGHDVSAGLRAAFDVALPALRARLSRAPGDIARSEALAATLQSALTLEAAASPEKAAGELVGLRENILRKKPKEVAALVQAYSLRADANRAIHDSAAMLADADRLEKLANDAIAAGGLTDPTARALSLSYTVRANARSKGDAAGRAALLLAGLQRLKTLEPANPVLAGYDRSLAYQIANAIADLVSAGKPEAAGTLEQRLLSAIGDPAEQAELRGRVAYFYEKAGQTAQAIDRYQASLDQLAVQPLEDGVAREFFSQAGDIIGIRKKDAASFDGAVFAGMLAGFVSDERIAALGKKEGSDATILSLADRLHDFAGRFDAIGDNASRTLLLRREVAMREPLMADAAKRASRLDDLADAYRELREALSDADADEEALVYARKRVDLRREQADKRSFAFAELSAYAWALRDLGDEQRYTSKDDEAVETYKEADRVATFLIKRFSRERGSYEVASAVASALGNGASSSMFRIIYHKRAEAIDLQHLKVLGGDGFDYDFLAYSENSLASDYLSLEKYEVALGYLDKALAASDKSMADAKEDRDLLKRRSSTLEKMARAQRALGRTDALVQTLRQRVDVLETLQNVTGKPASGQAEVYKDLAALLAEKGGDANELAALKAKAQAQALPSD